MIGRGAILGACLALPLACQASAAGAAQPEAGHYVYVPPGATVVILPAPDEGALPGHLVAMPSAAPLDRIFAAQDAMMRRVMADMDALMAKPFPDP